MTLLKLGAGEMLVTPVQIKMGKSISNDNKEFWDGLL